MKTVIFCTSYINSENGERYKKWIDYYYPKLKLFNASDLFLIDDGSPNLHFDKRVNVLAAHDLPESLHSNLNLFHFKNRLGRSSIMDYPGWWRSFTFSIQLAQKYRIDKIIHIESDFYVLSRRMIEYIENLSTGWTAFFSNYYGFPETAIQVICNDAFAPLSEIAESTIRQGYKYDRIAEYIFPFTHIEKCFHGDRFGEQHVLQDWLNKNSIPFAIDYFGQMNPGDRLQNYEGMLISDFQG